jgi:hypothetical protein
MLCIMPEARFLDDALTAFAILAMAQRAERSWRARETCHQRDRPGRSAGAATRCDLHGAKYAVIVGLVAASAAGLLYFVSLRLADQPGMSVAILLIGRGVFGGAESFIITGATVWGIARVGAWNAGKVIGR